MTVKRLIAGTVLAGTLASTAAGLGAGLANAQPGNPGPGPVIVAPQRPDIPWQDRDGYFRAVRDNQPFSTRGSG